MKRFASSDNRIVGSCRNLIIKILKHNSFNGFGTPLYNLLLKSSVYTITYTRLFTNVHRYNNISAFF